MRIYRRFKIFKNKYKGLHFKNILKQNTEEFCRNTTLHGLKYVADTDLRPNERCFFALSFVTVVALVTYLILGVYAKWVTTPVIVSIKPEPNFVSDIPFPAVTICNFNQALASKVKDFPKNSPEYDFLQVLCKRNVNASVTRTLTDWNYLERFIANISQPCEDMLVSCRFGGRALKCRHIFHPLVTDEGLCCVFNMLHPKFMYTSHTPYTYFDFTKLTKYEPVDWHAEMGYTKNLPNKFYPRKAIAIGESFGLSVTLDVQRDKYYCSSSSGVGFKFAVHSPNESPNIHETGILIENGKETKLRIRPEKIESDANLRPIRRELRYCLFHNEGDLKFFAHYTQRNCEMECIAEIIEKHCGCVSFFMPKIFNNISVCGLRDAHCERTVLLRMDNTIKSCCDDCLPCCHDLNYQVDAFSSKISHEGFHITNPDILNMSQEYVRSNVAVVHMYFKESSFHSFKQSEYIGLTDFLSSIGGLLGLFLGFSFVSIAEIVYFGVIRPYRAIRKFPKKQALCDNMEKGCVSQTSISVKVSKKFFGNRSHEVFNSKKPYNDHNSVFGTKMPLPYLLNGNLEKHEKGGYYAWLE